MIDYGYEPVACEGKRPVGKEWQRRPNTRDAIGAERAKWPTAINTGLRTGRLVGIDIDLKDPAHVAPIEALTTEVLGCNDMQRIGSKGAMICYRNESPIGKIIITGERDGGRRPLLEILGTGQQFVAYGNHPDTGKPYEWPNAPMCAAPLVDKT